MASKVTVGFPGLGIDNFDINPVAVSKIFGLDIPDVRWYALIICTGMVLSFLYFYHRSKRTELILEDDVLNITLFAVPIGIVGARFLYVITNLEDYDGFLDMINIREGGLAIYGGIIFGGLTFLVYTKIKRLSTLKFLDAISPAVMIGQIVGRWGNFMNGEAYGWSEGVEKLPWRMYVSGAHRHDPVTGNLISLDFVHPTFLYESVWNLIGFIIANILYRKKKFNGQIFFFYVAWYGLGRGFIELLRTDSLSFLGMEKLMVWLGFISCAVAVTLYVVFYVKNRNKIDEVAEFVGAKAVMTEAEATEQNEKSETESAEESEEEMAND